ncbi:MAG: glycosyltransferase family 4 protein [Longimicrobiales bacterium]
MNILKVWDSEYPWDVRAEKVMRSLTAAGHDVHLVARNRKGQPVLEQLPEATVHRLRPWRWLGRALDSASQFPAFMNPRWLSHMVRTGREIDAEVIVVRDLPLAPTAVWAGRRLGIPVIMDMAENYPAMIRDVWLGGRQGRLDFLVRNPRFVSMVERWSVDALDHVVVVVEESGERLEVMGVDPERLTVVCNTPWPSRIPSEDALVDHGHGEGPLRLVYLGLLEKPRGIEAVLRGMAILRDEGFHTTLQIIGGGMDEALFKSEARRLGFDEDAVRFHGVLPYEEALAVFTRSHVGLVPHLAVESWNTTIPNKLFDYMSHGLPVVTSDARPAARIVREVGAGAVFRSDDAEDFAAALRGLRDPARRREHGARGRQAVLDRYNWGEDEKRLEAAVTGTVTRYREGSRP